MQHLHITNGDSTADLLLASRIPGEVIAWRDPMHHGPFPHGLSLDELRPLRAKHLAFPGMSAADVAQDLLERDTRLRALSRSQSVTLWFEHDLLDQLQILQLLDWFASETLTGTDLQIICIDAFENITAFRGLGQLTADQLTTLHDQRVPVTQDMLRLAQRGWTAFRAPDPTDLADFVAGDLSTLPFLHAALTRHLQEFPSTSTGLSRSETQLLTLASAGPATPQELFVKNMDLESALFIGDWSTFAFLDRLLRLDLLTSNASGLSYHAPEPSEQTRYRAQQLSITDKGKKALSGDLDPATLIDTDRWLGGVEFQAGKPNWTWDDARLRLVPQTG